jgi:hypothetical protein
MFKSDDARRSYMAAYDAMLRDWPVAYEELDLATRLGPTHQRKPTYIARVKPDVSPEVGEKIAGAILPRKPPKTSQKHDVNVIPKVGYECASRADEHNAFDTLRCQ